jgi:crotonobetainyl-CoA:carnitine CoA-transferase CaiB-like acyl-CoA transferase
MDDAREAEAAPAAALSGVRVVELGGGVAGPFAARLLGDLGADVVKLEPPAGDPARRLEPFASDRDGRACSLVFEFLNWNKRGVVADLATDAGRDAVRALAADADILIESLGPGELTALGLAPADLRAANPELVITSVSGFGQEGPYASWRATDLVLQAMSGVMAISGTSDREPLKHGLRQSLYGAGLNAAYASLAAHLGRLRGGGGADVDLSVLECLSSQLVLNEAHYAFLGAVQGRRPPVQDPLAGDPLPAADGWVSLQNSGLIPVARLAELFDDSRLAEPRFASVEERTEHAQELNAILTEHLARETRAGFFARSCAAGYLSGQVQGAADLLSCPQLAARDVFHAFEDLSVNGAPVRFPATLMTLSRTPTSVRRRAPALDEHADAPLARTGRARPPAIAGAGGEDAGGPLAGVRVVDLSTVFAVPYIGGLLADLGAEVIKVEAPHRLDQTRTWFGPYYDNAPGQDWWDRSATFHVVNRGKRSVSLHLGHPDGRALLGDLVGDADVLLDNFTPRVMRGWGTTYEALRERNPRLVMLSNTGYGSTGPWSPFRAQGTSLEATMGISHVTGYAGGKPSKVGQSYPDFLAAWTGLTALMGALIERERSGQGQWIDLGMYQLGASVIPEALLHFQAHGEELTRRGNADLGALVSGVFPAAGEDRWLAVSVQDAAQLDALAAIVPGLEALPENDAQALTARVAAALTAWSREHDGAAAAARLQSAGIAAGPVLDARDLLLDPHLCARGFYEEVDFGPQLGRRPLIGRPYRWSAANSRVAVRGPGPAFAEANRYVLQELLRRSPAELVRLAGEHVIADAPVGPPRTPAPIDLAVLLHSRSLTGVDADYRDVLAARSSGG